MITTIKIGFVFEGVRYSVEDDGFGFLTLRDKAGKTVAFATERVGWVEPSPTTNYASKILVTLAKSFTTAGLKAAEREEAVDPAEPAGMFTVDPDAPIRAVQLGKDTGHDIRVKDTGREAIMSGRPRYLVCCNTCWRVLHHATTGPESMVKAHIDDAAFGRPMTRDEIVEALG